MPGAELDGGSTSGHLESNIPSTSVVPQASAAARYLYVWAGDKDEKESDFLAVVDVRSSSPTYAQVIATEPVGMTGTMPHHLEYQLPGPGQLLSAAKDRAPPPVIPPCPEGTAGLRSWTVAARSCGR